MCFIYENDRHHVSLSLNQGIEKCEYVHSNKPMYIKVVQSQKVLSLLFHCQQKMPNYSQISRNSTLLHLFVIFPVSETIFGMSGCFPVSQGQEMKDLTASSGRKAMRGCQCSFSAQVRLKNSHQYKKLFLTLVK